jgi:hypothetical protein
MPLPRLPPTETLPEPEDRGGRGTAVGSAQALSDRRDRDRDSYLLPDGAGATGVIGRARSLARSSIRSR